MPKSRCTAKIRSNALIEQTNEAQYWLGFLMADGSVSKSTNEIKLKIQISDFRHIVKFSQYLGLPITRCRASAKDVCISFSSALVKRRLADQGITSQKTYNAQVKDKILRQSRFFWAGYFDGDGTIGKYAPNEGQTNFFFGAVSGSKVLIQQFAEFLYQNTGVLPKVSVVFKKTENYHIRLGGKKAARAAQLLYADNPYALERKAELAKSAVLRFGSLLEGNPVDWQTETNEPYIRLEKNPRIKNRPYRVNGPNEFYVGSFSNLDLAIDARDMYFSLLNDHISPENAKRQVISVLGEYFPKNYDERPSKVKYDKRRNLYCCRVYYQSGIPGQKGSDIYIFEHFDRNLVEAVNNIAHKLRDIGYVYEGRRVRLQSEHFVVNHSLPKTWQELLIGGGVTNSEIEELHKSLSQALNS